MENIYRKKAEAMKGETVGLYRRLHRCPEVAHEEVRTHQVIRETLKGWGIGYEAPKDNVTVALVEGKRPGATVGIRCDTDALPVTEETGLEYASENPGVMHACGHDGHMAMGLCAARMLAEERDTLAGRVKVIFQPAEEGERGADEVMATGLVDDVDVFFAIHLWSPHKTGTLHVAPVAVSAAVDMFEAVIEGKGGHGATPEKCFDAICAGAAMVQSMQTIVSRRISPMKAAVVTVGSFHAGTVGNVVAGEARLRGTMRALDEETRVTLEEELDNIGREIGAAYHCRVEIRNERISDAVINDERAAALARECAVAVAGEEHVEGQWAMMLGDDIANYGRIAPICYAQLGVADEKKGSDVAHHNGRFRIDEDVLPTGAAWMAEFARRAGEMWRKH